MTKASLLFQYSMSKRIHTTVPSTVSRMSTSNIAPIPRFLLPQLSWKATTTPFGGVPKSLSYITKKQLPSSGENRRTCAIQSLGVNTKISSIVQQQRSFHATTPKARDHHFDTLKFVQRLKDEGFSEPQAVAMMKVLSDVIEER